MSSLPKISIVIPSLNKVDYIEETLESVVTQDYPDFEVIIQDGGSTDGTLEIIKKYAKKYPDLIDWESKKDKGQTEAINKGLKKAKGEIVSFINADDTYEKGALRDVGKHFAKHSDALWIAGRGDVIDAKGNEIAKWVTWYKNFLLAINHYSLLLMVNYLMQPSVFLSSKAYKKYGPFTAWKKGVLEYNIWLKLGKDKMPNVLQDKLSHFRLTKTGISLSSAKDMLARDYNIAKKYTNNSLIVVLHKMHNLVRKIWVW